MNIMLNEYCNLNCAYCFAENVKGKQNMSDENLQICIDYLKKSNRPILRLLGGEPTLHPKFVEIVQNGINDPFFQNITIFTNGLALTPDVVDKISSPKVGYLFNLNSPKHIGQQKYDKTVSNIRYIASKYGPENIGLGINIFEPDFEYDYIVDLLMEIKSPAIRFSIVCPMTVGETTSIDYYRQFMPQMVNMLRRCKEDEINACFDCPNIPMCVYEEFDMEHEMRIFFLHGYRNDCMPVLDVKPDLTIARCFPFADKLSINLLDYNDLNEVDEKFREIIDSHKFNHNVIDKCKDCEHLKNKKCQGGCMAFNYKEEQ